MILQELLRLLEANPPAKKTGTALAKTSSSRAVGPMKANWELVDDADMSESDINKFINKRVDPRDGEGSSLDYDARYKQFDIDMRKKHLHWVTQGTENDAATKKAAHDIAEMFKNQGLKGWTIFTILRDNYTGDDDDKWQTAKS